MKTINTDSKSLKISDFQDKSLLILDDDDPFRGRLARAMEKKGFQVKEAKNVDEGLKIVENSPGDNAVELFNLCQHIFSFEDEMNQ